MSVADRFSVVLVDDSVDVRTLVRMRLEASGLFEVAGEAEDGEQAIDAVLRHDPDLVLLDVSMPRMDGLETLPSILAVRPRTTVVMFTGFSGSHLTTEVQELGAADLIEKSVPLDQLPARLLRSLVAERSSLDAAAGDPRTPPQGDAGVEPPVQLRPTSATTRDTARATTGESPARLRDAASAARVEQQVLDEHLEGFREVFDRAAIGMATLTLHATIVRANEALADLVACEPRDLVGVDFGQLTTGQGEVLDSHLEALRAGRSDVATFEHPLPTVPGMPAGRTARVTLVPVRDSAGQVLYAFAQVQDISALRAAEHELHRSEETFRLLVDAVAEYAVFMLDTSGHVASWNAGARRIKGYAAEEIVGRHFEVFYPADEQRDGHPQRNLEAALRDGSYAEEGWRVRRDGTRFWASVTISTVHDDVGRHVGFAKVTRDQTPERERAQERAAAMAEQSWVLAVTAHELRHPAALIDGSALALAADDSLDAAERERLLAQVRSGAERLRRLADDLTTASQLQRAGMRFEPRAARPADLVLAAAERRADEAGDCGVEVDVPDGVVVAVDEVRIAQALDNLLDNAVRHGEPPVTVGASLRGETVELRVTDRGTGVPPDVVARLFDRFGAGGPAGGTGLGLYLVREIAHLHGGEVVYEAAADGRPTTFVLQLPVHG